MLSAAESATQEPLRSELYSPHHLADHARALGAKHSSASFAGPVAPLLREFRRGRSDLEAAYGEIDAAVRASGSPDPAEEWLLDNMHVVRDQLREIAEDLPPGFLVQLPRLREAPWAGYPRVYALALDFITHTDARLDRENLLLYVRGYQEHAPLTIGELWAVAIMLRLGLIENLRRLARHEVAARAERALADGWADRLLARVRERPAHGVVALAELATSEQPLTDGFVTQLLKRLRNEDLPLGPMLAWLEDRLAEVHSSAEEVTRRERHRQATNQVSVGHCITSMRLITALDWSDFFESASVVEAILLADPAGAYATMDAHSRDHYRHEVERLASRSGEAEPEVARRAVALAAAAGSSDGDAASKRRRHIGYFLIDDGRQRLEADLGYRLSPAERLHRFALEHALAVYLWSISALMVALIGLTIGWAAAAGFGWGWLIVIVLLIGLPATEVATSIVNVAVASALPPRVLPKLQLDSGVPPGCRTVVAVPALFTSPDAVRELVDDLEIRFLGNQDPCIYFALLMDFSDAAQEELPQDAELLALAREGIGELNRKHAAGSDDRFHLLHRHRRWNRWQGAWMGWERKRGKLEDFNRLLRGGTDSGFEHDVGDPTGLRGVRYVITLDADTHLPRDTARRLIGTIAHPLNRAVFDSAQRRVIEGYGVIQPRVSATLTSARRSLFARAFTGNTGLDPYTTAVSDVYQDLFGEGSYYGKGIYDVDAFVASLGGRVPENRLLSHDLFEGLFARVALVSDIELHDEFPSRYSVYAARQRRWVRGDWQLAPWLLPHVPTADGRSRLNDVPALARWKLFDNLRRSLLAPATVALLVASWTALPGPAWAWTAIALAGMVMPIFAHLATLLVRANEGAWIVDMRGAWSNLRTNLLQAGIKIALLAEQALLALEAIVRTLGRLIVTRRHLLEWEAAAEAERRAAAGLGAVWRSMLGSQAAAAGILALVAIVRPGELPLALPFSIVWLASPFIAHRISRPTIADPDRLAALTKADRLLLRRTARKTWRFFEMFVTAQDSWLPPDNYQEDPKGVLARRTSPTNIGLYLLSALSARDFGYITLTDLADRLDQTLGTLERLERYRGHLYNWYDTATGQALHPAYVSTVDSGNLAGHLMALAVGCRDVTRAPLVGPPLLDGLEDALGLLREAVDAAGQREAHGALDELTAVLAGARAEPPCCVPAWRALVRRLIPVVESVAPAVLHPGAGNAISRRQMGRRHG